MFSQELDLLHMISNAGFVVIMVLLILLFFSVASWAIILIKHSYIKRAFKESSDFNEFFWHSRDLAETYNKSKELANSPLARVFRIGYIELKKIIKSGNTRDVKKKSGNDLTYSKRAGIDNIKRALRRSINSEINKMTKMVPFLATTGNTAPFIGLFGTVWGIMNSFHGIGLKGTASLAVVAPGISEALVATAAGLASAIPAVIAFNFFIQKIRTLETELQNFSADFLNIIERDILVRKD